MQQSRSGYRSPWVFCAPGLSWSQPPASPMSGKPRRVSSRLVSARSSYAPFGERSTKGACLRGATSFRPAAVRRSTDGMTSSRLLRSSRKAFLISLA